MDMNHSEAIHTGVEKNEKMKVEIDSQGDLSKRVHFLKLEKGGQDEMCEVSEKWYREGEAQGEMRKARETAYELADMGLPVEKIAKAVKVNLETVQKWLSGNMSVTK